MEEEMKEVQKRMMEIDELRTQLKSNEVKARKEGKPFCSTCYRMDAERNKLRDYKHYTEGFKIVKEETAKLKEYSKKDSGVMYKLIDYVCPKGHGVSLMYREEEYNEIFKKKSKDDK